MPQIVPSQTDFAMDLYAYTDSFDLSLLKSDDEDPMSVSASIDSKSFKNSTSITSIASPMSPEYISAQIFHCSAEPMKKSLSWNPNSQNNHGQMNNKCVAMEEDPPEYGWSLPSPPQETTVSSPTPSFVNSSNFTSTMGMTYLNIKQEILPPSPPESDAAFESDGDVVKNEPDTESCINIKYFLKDTFDSMNQSNNISDKKQQQDHQLLRERLQDTSFQKKHNLKPVALETLFNGWNLRGDIEPVISLALEQAKCDIKATCSALDISPGMCFFLH